ncbi:MAG: hypothetical protein H0U66_01980 [Gemmatimonadaceae bacterium]|nr:hypothetical protein [Gemmatimonadaceae bacterium]
MIKKKKTAASAKKSTTPAVIVRAYSGVFFGYLVAKDGTSVTLKGARQVWSWDSAGLPEPSRTCGDIATRGLGTGSKVSGPADAIVDQVGAVFFCTPVAVRIIDAQKWATR